MQNANLSFAKIVATPTETAWSQAYNAGRLFAVLSLSTKEPDEKISLAGIGKECVNILQSEFFTLEEKNLAGIKRIVQASFTDVPSDVSLSFSLVYLHENILYLILYGPGKITMKRHGQTGILLETNMPERETTTASGFIKNGDTVLLQTAQFASLIPEQEIKKAFEVELPNDIAEIISPHVHQTENGNASAIVIHFNGISDQPVPAVSLKKETIQEQKATSQSLSENVDSGEETDDAYAEETDKIVPAKNRFRPSLPRFSFNTFPIPLPKSKKVRLFSLLAIVLLILLVATVLSTVKKQQDLQTEKRFAEVYAAAKNSYEQGVALLPLNPTYAREDLQKAKETLNKNIAEFKKGSEQEKKLSALLAQINENLGQTSNSRTAATKEADTGKSPLLASFINQKETLLTARYKTTVYAITAKAIQEYTGTNGKAIITNKKTWDTIKGFGAYNGNLYVLDPSDTVTKFVAAGNSYATSSYFAREAPNLKNAVSMAIDGSVWILYSDGKIEKYTKGTKQTFTIKALEKPLSSPSIIYTDTETSALYVLDSGNNRIVQLTKDGAYQKEFIAPVFKSATAVDIQEAAKKGYVLQNGKIWEFSL